MRHFTSYKPRRRLNTHERRRVNRLKLGHVERKARCEDIGGELIDHVVHGKVMGHPEKGLWPKMRWQRCLIRCPLARAERHGPRAKGPGPSPRVEAGTRLRRRRWRRWLGRWWSLCLGLRCAELGGAEDTKGATLCLGWSMVHAACAASSSTRAASARCCSRLACALTRR